MKNYTGEKIRNIIIAGHSGSGKTSLVQSLLYKTGNGERATKIPDASVYTTLSSFENGDLKINLLDTPGLFDYEGETVQGIHAGGCVAITVSAKSGVKVGTHKAFDKAKELGKPTMFIVTKIDDENANFYNVLTQLKSEFGSAVCPVIVPVIADSKIVSYVNLIEMQAYKYDQNGNAVPTDMPTAEISEKMEYRMDGLVEAISEAVAETDENLLEKFISGETFTQQELIDGIHSGVNSGSITPVVCVSSADLSGIDMLLKEFSLLLPAPTDFESKAGEDKNGDIVEIKCDDSEPTCAFVFKTLADPYGKLSYIKVASGVLKSGDELVNATTGESIKIGKLMTICNKKQIPVEQASAGDIVVCAKLDASTNDTLCNSARVVSLENIKYPNPCYKMAVKAKSQGDEGKINSAMSKLLEEDKTLKYQLNENTNEMILSGLGEQHIAKAVAKLKNDFGVEIVLKQPQIAYKETICKKVKVQGKHKKQSGGHGQYGDVWIEFEPCISDSLVFEEKVFGGAVPKNFFPAVEKGLADSVKHGVLAGFPVVNLKAILVDGSYHPVDSSEMAFKMAASVAYKEGMRQAQPTLLEPISSLSVLVPDDNTGDMMGELNKRRGRVLGMNPADKKGLTEIVAEVPESEMSDFTMTLRQMTQGRGNYTLEFARYEQLPSHLVSDVIAKHAVEA